MKPAGVDRFVVGRSGTVLVIVDVQERLAAAMPEKSRVVTGCLRLIEAAKILKIPLIVTEQYPKGLGPTVRELQEALPQGALIEKTTFDCCQEPGFLEAVSGTKAVRAVLAGMEAHICVLQTGLGLLREGYGIHVARDAVCSRKEEDCRTGLAMARDAGAVITSTEIVLFQLLGRAGTPEFKAVSRLVK